LLKATPLILSNAETFSKVWQFSHVHVRTTDFVFRSFSAGSHLRSAPILNKFNLLVPEGTVPLGFCFGGFSSTAGYVPGNEAQVRRPKRRSTRSVDHLRGALLVFIRVTGKVFRLFLQAFRLRPWRSRVAAFRSFYSRTMRHRIRSTSRSRSRCP